MEQNSNPIQALNLEVEEKMPKVVSMTFVNTAICSNFSRKRCNYTRMTSAEKEVNCSKDLRSAVMLQHCKQEFLGQKRSSPSIWRPFIVVKVDYGRLSKPGRALHFV